MVALEKLSNSIHQAHKFSLSECLKHNAASVLEMNRAMDTQIDTWPTNAFSVFPVPILTS